MEVDRIAWPRGPRGGATVEEAPETGASKDQSRNGKYGPQPVDDGSEDAVVAEWTLDLSIRLLLHSGRFGGTVRSRLRGSRVVAATTAQ